MNKKSFFLRVMLFLFAMTVIFSFIFDIEWGKNAGMYFWRNLIEMAQIIPFAFVLIALFEKWVSREQVIKQLGDSSGLKGYLWALLLAGLSVGGIYVMYPLAASMYKKGAPLKIVFAYLGFAGVCRIPMVMFEISFLGPTFTFIRLLIAIPLAGIAGSLLGSRLAKHNYKVMEPSE